MDKLYSNATIRRIKEEHNFRLSKSLGQNFLTDGNIVAKIVDSCEATEEDGSDISKELFARITARGVFNSWLASATN